MVRRSPVVSFGGNKKAAVPLGTAAPGPRLWSRAPRSGMRVTSDPILRTAGPPAHTHVPGDVGCESRSANGRPCRDAVVNRQTSVSGIASAGDRIGLAHVPPSPPRSAPTSPRRSTTRSSAACASSARSDLPPGEVEIRVDWSSVNYKDGLATRADGKVARISPLIPGIDLAGEVVALGRSRPVAVGERRPGPRLRAGRLAPRRVRRVPARAGRLGRAACARAVAARRDVDRDGRVHGGDVRRRARGARARARRTGRCW